MIPTIRKPGSEIWISFNPELETDDTYQRFVVSPPNAVVVKTSFRDNPALSEELMVEIEHLKATDPDEYEHVYEGMCLQTGRSIRDQSIAAGRRVRVMPQIKVEQSITAARTIFGKCFFDAEKCADGIQALRHYRYEVDEGSSSPSFAGCSSCRLHLCQLSGRGVLDTQGILRFMVHTASGGGCQTDFVRLARVTFSGLGGSDPI